jgi:hypothetical protein
VISETERLLNPSATELTPAVRYGTLFPFGDVSEGLELSAWMKAYAVLKDETFPAYPLAIEHAFRQVGFKRSMTLTGYTPGKLTDDHVASEVCNLLRLDGAPGAEATNRIPYSEDDTLPVQMCLNELGVESYVGHLMHGMDFRRGSFLTELVKRGALLIRPSNALLEAITNKYLSWYADVVHRAFGDRIKTVDLALGQLRLARKADKAREAKWASVGKFTARSSSKCMEAFAQALEGMASDAQKGKKK